MATHPNHPSIRPAIEELPSNASQASCAYGSVVLSRALCPPDAAYLRDWISAVLQHGTKHPQGLGLLIVIDEHAPPPSDTDRELIKQAFSDVKSVVHGIVQVVEGQGFLAAAKRGAMSIMSLAMKVNIPIKIVGSVSEGVPVLQTLLGRGPEAGLDGAGLARAAETLRVRLTPG